MPAVSIIIPSYNQSRFVAETVRSALAQTHTPLEVIVVDDGSTDDTREVLRPFLDQIQYLRQENRGLAAARNSGYRASSGEYLLFLDSDDLIAPQKCALHVALMEAHPDQALSYSAWQQISEDERQVLGEVYPGYEGHLLKPLLLRRFFFFASSAVLRRSCLEKVGLFDESIRWGEDADLWLRLALAGYAFGYLYQPLLQYRINNQSMTANINPRQVQDWLAIQQKFFSRPDLPEEVRALEAESFAVLHFETAGRYFRQGSFTEGEEHLRLGFCPPSPPVQPDWFLEWLAGTALDPRTPDPQRLIDAVFDHLPAQARNLKGLRRKAHGRFHAAAAFSVYNTQNHSGIVKHILPAIGGEPGLLFNPGFLRLVIHSLSGRWR